MDCDDELRARIAANLRPSIPAAGDAPEARRAAVAVTVTDVGFGADLPGLPRTRSGSRDAAAAADPAFRQLRSHPGQWALPGGRLDGSEAPAAYGAARNARGGFGFAARQAVLGRLDDFVTRSGFVMTPGGGLGRSRPETWPTPGGGLGASHSAHRAAAGRRAAFWRLLRTASSRCCACRWATTTSPRPRRRSCISFGRCVCSAGPPGSPTSSSRGSPGAERSVRLRLSRFFHAPS
jgi:8-oxo-dGTP pyrophosphatase MutT (NUDIX family)